MLSPCFTPQLGERISPIYIYIFFVGNRIHGSVGTVKQQPTNTNQPVSESWILLGIFQGGKVIFCMTSEVSGNHIVTNSTNTSWQSWRYLKTPFLFIPSQNGWWSCPSRTWGDPIFIYINHFYFKDLIILSLQPFCSYIYIFIVFLNDWRRKLQKSLQRVNTWGWGVFGSCTAMALLCRWEDDKSSFGGAFGGR